MEQIIKQKLTVSITCTEEITLSRIENALHTLNKSLTEFYKIYRVVLNEKNEALTDMYLLYQNTVVVDIVACVTDALVETLVIIIKEKFKSQKEYSIKISIKNVRIPWSEEDTYELVSEVLKEYVVGKGTVAISDFVNSVLLSKKYGKGSLRMKIQNIKQLMNENQIPNALNVLPLGSYSKMLKNQFKKACKDLNIA